MNYTRLGMLVLVISLVLTPYTIAFEPLETESERDAQALSTSAWHNGHNVFISFDTNNKTETYVIEPRFDGKARDFGLIMAFPNEPALSLEDSAFFADLARLEEHFTASGVVGDAHVSDEKIATQNTQGINHVSMIERMTLSDLDVTLVAATTTHPLTRWLQQNDYSYSAQHINNFRSYVEKSWIFALIRVDMSQFEDDEMVDKTFPPLKFTFKSVKPVLPVSLYAKSADHSSRLQLKLYTLADHLTFIPGAELSLGKLVEQHRDGFYPALSSYLATEQTFGVSQLEFDLTQAEEDTYLSMATIPDQIASGDGSQTFAINPHTYKQGTGLIAGSGISVITSVIKLYGDKPLHPFMDVQQHWAQKYIEHYYLEDVVDGYPDRTFRPNHGINRAEASKVVLRGLKLPNNPVPKSMFSDVKMNDWFAQYVGNGQSQGWIGGYADGTFRPGALITRAEATKIIVEVFFNDIITSEASLNEFHDLDSQAWYIPYMSWAVEHEMMHGYGDFTLRPNDPITRAEFLKILYVAESWR